MSEQRFNRWFTEWPSTHERAGQTVEVVPASWDGLMAILDTYYPAEVFTGESGDVGARIVVLTRELARLRAVENAARETHAVWIFGGDFPAQMHRLRSALSKRK